MSRLISRRDVLVRGAATVAASTLLASTRTARGLHSAQDDVVLAVMGLNGRGSALASEFAELSGVRLAWLCDVDQKAVDKVASDLRSKPGISPETTNDFRRILDDKAVDALVIATPDHWHAPATILACAAGKHVYVEKPASHNANEGELMVAAARKHQRVVQLGTQRRSSPGLREAIQKLGEGEIGKVRFARGWINSTRPSIGQGKQVAPPSELDFELWQGPAPRRPYQDNLVHYNWHWFWHWGTGELGNNGIHALDICRFGLGVDAPKRVTCGGERLFFDDDQQTPDTQIATFVFDDAVINWEHRTWNKRGFEGQLFGIAFYGDQGALVIDSGKYAVFDMEGAKKSEVPISRGEIEHLENFLSAIREGKPLNAEIEQGVKSTLLCHLGNIAYRTGRTVNFDSQSRRLLNDPEQEKLWGREYESGWEPKV